MRAPISVALLLAAILYQTPAFGTPVDVSRAEDVAMSSERLAYLRSDFEGLVDDQESGGFQILVSRRGKVVMYENLGLANVEKNIPVTAETLFRMYSMTKPVMGVAMMMLYEEGQYSLADPLSKHIPEFAELRVYVGEDDEGNVMLEPMQREPTIHDLLQHTAGFTYGICCWDLSVTPSAVLSESRWSSCCASKISLADLFHGPRLDNFKVFGHISHCQDPGPVGECMADTIEHAVADFLVVFVTQDFEKFHAPHRRHVDIILPEDVIHRDVDNLEKRTRIIGRVSSKIRIEFCFIRPHLLRENLVGMRYRLTQHFEFCVDRIPLRTVCKFRVESGFKIIGPSPVCYVQQLFEIGFCNTRLEKLVTYFPKDCFDPR